MFKRLNVVRNPFADLRDNSRFTVGVRNSKPWQLCVASFGLVSFNAFACLASQASSHCFPPNITISRIYSLFNWV